jgi:hypothetical protein
MRVAAAIGGASALAGIAMLVDMWR